MAAQTRELVSDIDRARADLEETLEVIGDRIAPKKVMARAKANVAHKVDAVKHKVSPAHAVKLGREKARVAVGRALGGDDDTTAARRRRALPPAATAGPRAGLALPLPHAPAVAAASNSTSPAERARELAGRNPVAAGLLTFAAGILVASVLKPDERLRELSPGGWGQTDPLEEQAATIRAAPPTRG